MRLAELPGGELTRRLKGPGALLEMGPFVVRLRSPLARVADGLQCLYADYVVLGEPCFADFDVRVTPPASLRRWIRPQVVFLFDERSYFLPLPAAQAYPMLEWSLNWCVHQHTHVYLIIHAAVVERGGYAAVLPGAPGAGKSTLCAALVNRGWRLLSDELALLSLDGATLTPIPRPVSLKNQSIALIRSFAPEAIIGPAARDTQKGTVAHMRAPAESVARRGETAAPAWLIFPRYDPDATACMQASNKGEMLMAAARQSFNYSALGLAGFRNLTGLVDRCACFEFSYGDLDAAVKVFDELESGADPARRTPR